MLQGSRLLRHTGGVLDIARGVLNIEEQHVHSYAGSLTITRVEADSRRGILSALLLAMITL